MSSLEAFFSDKEPTTPCLFLSENREDYYNPKVDSETHLRIKLAIYAYSYEFDSFSIVSDAEFDKLCSTVDFNINTRRPDLDKWFRENFTPYTGQWIHNHPELSSIKEIYEKFYKNYKTLKKKKANRKS